MKLRTFRLRRVAAALTLGVGAAGGIAVGAFGSGGVAGATTTHAGGTIAATSAPMINHTGANQAAGTLKLTLSSAWTLAGTPGPTPSPTGKYYELILTAKASGGGSVTWTNASVTTKTIAEVGTPIEDGTKLYILLGTKTVGTTADVTVSNIKYTTVTGKGHVGVHAVMYTVTLPTTFTPATFATTVPTYAHGTTQFTFSPTRVTNATFPATPVAAATVALAATANLPVSVGATGQKAGTWALTFSGSPTTNKGWTTGSYVSIEVDVHTGTNCTGNDYVYFTGTPTVTVVSSSGVSAAPTVKATLASSGACSTGPHKNVLDVVFTNSGVFNTPTGGAFTIVISTVRYDVGSTPFTIGHTPTTDGNVKVTAQLKSSKTAILVTITAGTTTPNTAAASNAHVAWVYVTANTPPVKLTAGTFAAPISPVNLVQSVGAEQPAGYVCIAADGDYDFNAGDTAAKASVPTGNGTVTPTVTYQTVFGHTTATYVRFTITAPGSDTHTTYSVSGLEVNVFTASGPQDVYVFNNTTGTCKNGGPGVGKPTHDGTFRWTNSKAVAFTVRPATFRIYGATADATAAAELEHEYPYNGTQTQFSFIGYNPTSKGACPGYEKWNPANNEFTYDSRPVVLATTGAYQDALSSQYLASYLGTGTLLTPGSTLSTTTLSALRVEGITHVYVIGGPLAISTAVVSALEATPVYQCGGTAEALKTTGSPVDLQVTRIFGQTAEDTSNEVAIFPGVNQGSYYNVAGAYASGQYNTTTGTESAKPVKAGWLNSAIVATALNFQDAESASTLAYADHIPLLLTTPTTLSTAVRQGIYNLHIQQVFLMGGPLAVSNTVVTELESLGVSVLRIAGQDATATAVNLADFEMNHSATTFPYHTATGLLWADTHTGSGFFDPLSGNLTVARGDYYSDGLTGAVVAAHSADACFGIAWPGAFLTEQEHTYCHFSDFYGFASPLVLTENPTTVGSYLTAFLHEAGTVGIDGNGATTTTYVTHLTILGGPLAISTAVVAQMRTDL